MIKHYYCLFKYKLKKKIYLLLILALLFIYINKLDKKSIFQSNKQNFNDYKNLLKNKRVIKIDISNKKFKNKNHKIRNLKLCLCTPAKKENRYIREFVQYYEKYGIDKIYLYDNNEINGENFEQVIKDYIKKGFVRIINWRGIKNAAFDIMNDCYKKYNKYYDWILFYEVDEYIHLTNFTNIKDFLNQPRFKNCQKIHLNWVYHTDNNLIYYDNRTLHERFPEVEPNARMNKKGKFNQVKSILRGNIKNITIYHVHILCLGLKTCDSFGNKVNVSIKKINDYSDFKYNYIDHYYSKSLEEFIDKLNKGDVLSGQSIIFKYSRIHEYFKRNKMTLEKIIYIESKTKLNLSKYKKKFLKFNNIL